MHCVIDIGRDTKVYGVTLGNDNMPDDNLVLASAGAVRYCDEDGGYFIIGSLKCISVFIVKDGYAVDVSDEFVEECFL